MINKQYFSSTRQKFQLLNDMLSEKEKTTNKKNLQDIRKNHLSLDQKAVSGKGLMIPKLQFVYFSMCTIYQNANIMVTI